MAFLKQQRMSTAGTICKSWTSVEGHLLYTHMSNHYRRIYNAKCSVDTLPSNMQKISHSKRCQPHFTLQLNGCFPTKLAVTDTPKNTKQPSCVCIKHKRIEDEVLRQARDTLPSQQDDCMQCCRQGRPRNRSLRNKHKFSKKVAAQDILDRHSQFFVSPNRSFEPRILKTEAHSKLRELKVYHPPYRKNIPLSCNVLQEVEEEALSARFSDLCVTHIPVSSKESSHDSAYNDGTSSGTQTPEQPSLVVLCSSECNDNLSSPAMVRRKSSIRKSQTNKKEEAAYIKFIHDITEDVLARGIYSNRGLRQLFERHVANNKGQLNLDRMRDEISRLCEQLGIPDSSDVDYENSCRDGVE